MRWGPNKEVRPAWEPDAPLPSDDPQERHKITRELEAITGLAVEVAYQHYEHGPAQWTATAAPYGRRVTALSRELRGLKDRFLSAHLALCREILLEQQKGRCKFCTSAGPLQQDHIRARAHGRNDRLSNLQLLCVRCHGRKTGRLAWTPAARRATA